MRRRPLKHVSCAFLRRYHFDAHSQTHTHTGTPHTARINYKIAAAAFRFFFLFSLFHFCKIRLEAIHITGNLNRKRRDNSLECALRLTNLSAARLACECVDTD